MPTIIAPHDYWGSGQPNPAYFSAKDVLSTAMRGNADLLTLLMDQLDVERRVRNLLEQHGCDVVIRDGTEQQELGPDEYLLYNPIDKAGQLRALQERLPQIPVPKTVGFNAFKAAPFFPVVVKHISGEAGFFQFLLEQPEQWGIFHKYVQTMSAIESDGETASPPVREESYLFQCYIETPSDRYTSFRVLTSFDGNILASGLFYSQHRKGEQKLEQRDSFTTGEPHDFLCDPKMPTFLDATDHRSNLARGGVCLPLKQGTLTAEEQSILQAHNIDPADPRLPETLRGYAEEIARVFGRQWGAVLGMDFIQSKDGKYSYLETNPDGDAELYYRMHSDRFSCKVDAHVGLYAEVFRNLLSRRRRRLRN